MMWICLKFLDTFAEKIRLDVLSSFYNSTFQLWCQHQSSTQLSFTNPSFSMITKKMRKNQNYVTVCNFCRSQMLSSAMTDVTDSSLPDPKYF